MLEGLPGTDGLHAETRMAWGRERGWRYHGPGQVHCWMVADLEDWNVFSPVNSFLLVLIGHILIISGSYMMSNE